MLQKDEPEIRRVLAENSRQMFLVRESEKKLQRKCLAYEESNSVIMKVYISLNQNFEVLIYPLKFLGE